jgi:hypothetical protein
MLYDRLAVIFAAGIVGRRDADRDPLRRHRTSDCKKS